MQREAVGTLLMVALGELTGAKDEAHLVHGIVLAAAGRTLIRSKRMGSTSLYYAPTRTPLAFVSMPRRILREIWTPYIKVFDYFTYVGFTTPILPINRQVNWTWDADWFVERLLLDVHNDVDIKFKKASSMMSGRQGMKMPSGAPSFPRSFATTSSRSSHRPRTTRFRMTPNSSRRSPSPPTGTMLRRPMMMIRRQT